MPMRPTVDVPLRIVVENPLSGVALALQRGNDVLEPPAAASPARVVFEFSVRLGAPQADGTPNFLGPYTQGSAAARFVYLGVGKRAGQAGSPWDGRVKVPLTGLTAAQVDAALAAPKKRLTVRFPGVGANGRPTLATVRLPADAWTLADDDPT